MFILLAVLALQQSTPNGGAITKYVPPVPTPSSFISDAKGVLNPASHSALDARLTAIQRDGLGDIAVAIVPSIGDYSPNQVSVEIYRTWKVGSMAPIGSAHRDVGVLLLIVPKELAPNHRGECWINLGTGAEGIITDATAGTICRDSIIPHLKNRDYAGAVGAGITAIEARLRGDVGLTTTAVPPAPVRSYPAAEESSPVTKGPIAVFGGGVLALGLLVFARWRRRHRHKCSHCGRMMRRLDERGDDAKLDHGQIIEEQVGSVDYDVWVCECGQATVLPYRSWFSGYSECTQCHRRTASSTRKTIIPATTVSSGTAEDYFVCEACRATWTIVITLPRISEASSSTGGGSGFSGSGSGSGGGGGGSSFGGSGSTSGGGGGGSY